MPRKRTQGKQRMAITIQDVSIDEFMAFQCGWDPDVPIPLGSYCDVRWTSLEEMDVAYAALRHHVGTEWWFGRPTFAEGRYLARLADRKGG